VRRSVWTGRGRADAGRSDAGRPDPGRSDSRRSDSGRSDAGQSTVELALSLPLVALLLLLLVQVGLVVRAQVLVTHAAREAAREAAVDPDPAAPRQAALASASLAADRLTVTATGRGPPGSRVRVEIRYRLTTDVPVVGALLPDVVLAAAATMRVER
jgi:hypothetical protein